jgi:hypothetical protein
MLLPYDPPACHSNAGFVAACGAISTGTVNDRRAARGLRRTAAKF